MELAGHNTATRRLTLGVVAAMAVMACGLAATGMTISLRSVQPLLMFVASLALLGLYCRMRGLSRLLPLVEVFALFIAASIALLPMTYLAIRFNMPLADAALARADAALGFDWLRFAAAVDRHPLLAAVLQEAYASFRLQLFLLTIYLALLPGTQRSAAFVAAFAMIVVAASIFSLFLPAVGAFAFHGTGPGDFANIDPHFGFAFLSEFEAVRTAVSFEMALDRIDGLLTFPSVHVAVAVLCAWAAWGSRLLRMPMLLLNAAMAVSAISHGGHYLVDVIAGIAVALVCIALALRLVPGASAATARAGEAALAGEIARLARRLRPRAPQPGPAK